MTRHRSLVLCAWLLAVGCKPTPPASDDLRSPLDFAQTADLTAIDLSVAEDLATSPDLTQPCPYGQERVNGTCECKMATHPNVCPGATHCCAAVQACLPMNRCSAPTARQRHGLAYDLDRKRLVVAGGLGAAGAVLGDTWEHDDVTFAPASAGMGPTPRYGHVIGYDGVSKRILLFGGRQANNMLSNETWHWDGANWTRLMPAQSPSARELSAMAWDNVRRRLVLFGGTNAMNVSEDDVWEWTGTNWDGPKTPAVRPARRSGHAMAYDSVRKNVVLFGGFVGGMGYNGETWLWDGQNWTRPMLAMSPPGRAYFDMAFDEERKVAVLFSGEIPGGIGTAPDDTWEWDGAVWTRKMPTTIPPRRTNHRLVYDPERKRVLLYGGSALLMGMARVAADLWAFDGMTWTSLY